MDLHFPRIRNLPGIVSAYKHHQIPRTVLSIPHSGTRSLCEMLDCEHVHTFVPWSRIDAEIEDDVVITPLRDPKKLWQSWLNRFNTVHKIDLDRFEGAWRNLELADKVYDIWYVPVDHPARDERLQAIADRLEIEVNPTWERVGHMGGDPEWVERNKDKLPVINWDYIYNLPFIKRLY